MGIIIGAFAGALFFIVFGLRPAVHAGSFSVLIILNKLKGGPIEGSMFVRVMIAAGIAVSIVLGITVAMLSGAAVGHIIEYVLMKMT